MPETVTVTNQAAFPKELHHLGFVVEDDPHLLGEIVEHPHIVVADEEVYLYPAVGQLRHLTEDACVTTRNEVAIREPEIEDVAQEEERLAIVFDAIKEAAKLPLTLEGILAAPQMCI